MPNLDSSRPPRVWALLVGRAGDNNQMLALAEALGWPFEAKRLRFNPLRKLPAWFAGAGTARLDAASRALLRPPWPDLVILVGRRSIPVARWIKAQAGGGTALVHIGRPRAPLRWFDLVVTTPQYGVPAAANVLGLPVPMSRVTPERLREAGEAWAAGLDAYPRPRLALLLGGPSPPLRPRVADAVDAFARLERRARREDGSVLVVGSRRTPPALVAAVTARARASEVPAALLGGDAYLGLLALADEVHVTADSAAMLGDAVASGHPVGLVPVGESGFGAALLHAVRRVRLAGGTPARAWDALARRGLVDWPRDLWFLWREAERLGLVGTPDRPARGVSPPSLSPPSPSAIHDEAVRPGGSEAPSGGAGAWPEQAGGRSSPWNLAQTGQSDDPARRSDSGEGSRGASPDKAERPSGSVPSVGALAPPPDPVPPAGRSTLRGVDGTDRFAAASIAERFPRWGAEAVAERVRRLLRPGGGAPARCDRDTGPPTPGRPAGRGGA